MEPTSKMTVTWFSGGDPKIEWWGEVDPGNINTLTYFIRMSLSQRTLEQRDYELEHLEERQKKIIEDKKVLDLKEKKIKEAKEAEARKEQNALAERARVRKEEVLRINRRTNAERILAKSNEKNLEIISQAKATLKELDMEDEDNERERKNDSGGTDRSSERSGESVDSTAKDSTDGASTSANTSAKTNPTEKGTKGAKETR